MLTNDQFVLNLRSALNHLYDPDRLRQSPLADLFGVAGQVDAHLHMKRILEEAIESLEPQADEPSQSPDRWTYEILFDRYIQRLSQQEVADHLGICVRHLRRRQRAALGILAGHLWERFSLEIRSPEDVGAEMHTTPMQSPETGPVAHDELTWLKDTAPKKAVSLDEVLPAVLDWAQPLAARYDTHLEIETSDSLPSLTVHSVALSQILLNLLSVVIHLAPGSRIHISAKPLRGEIEIQVHTTKLSSDPRSLPEDDTANLDMAHRLTELSGGRLTLIDSNEGLSATLSLPSTPDQLLVLAIDDNADTLQLLQRYTQNTRYHLVGERDPEEGLSIAQKLSPKVVVLDVMMPDVEGWEILARLLQHPLTRHIPVVVCTILAQRELALSLGASGFVRKPITRQAFLSVLDQQMERTKPLTETVSH
jgi:CheY-like chemotaxis protein